MKKIMVLLVGAVISAGALLCSNVSFASDKQPFKVAILSVATYKIVASGEGLGALDTMKESLSKEDQGTYAGINFGAINDQAVTEFAAQLATLNNVTVLSVSTEAFGAFKGKVDAANARFAFLNDIFKTTQDLPPAHVTLWINKITTDDQKKYMAEVGAAVKEYCEKAGVDAVWMVQNFPGYATKGLSKFLSKATMGSGKGNATMSFNYVLLDKNGEIITAKLNHDGKSKGDFWMKAGKATMDQQMEGFLKEAVTSGAKAIGEDVAKPIKKAQKK